jgi:hypothetical protein
VQWHPGALLPRVGFIITNLVVSGKRVVTFYNQRRTAGQRIKERKGAITTCVRVHLSHDGNGRRKRATLTVEDDAPHGFVDVRHVYTLYATSSKRSNLELRGRFTLGANLIHSLCESASIITTNAHIIFDEPRLEPPIRRILRLPSQKSALAFQSS